MKVALPTGRRLAGVVIVLVLVTVIVAAVAPGVLESMRTRYLTADQRLIVKKLGEPSRFTIAYLPLGRNKPPELVRTEVWYYPGHHQRIAFVRGRVVSVERMSEDPEKTVYPKLRPWDFSARMDRSAVESVTADVAVPATMRREDRPAGTEARVYATKDVLFAIQRGRLVYAQSLGRSPE